LYATKRVGKEGYSVLRRRGPIVLRILRKGIGVLEEWHSVLVEEDMVIALKVLQRLMVRNNNCNSGENQLLVERSKIWWGALLMPMVGAIRFLT
jgi:hypothetical protein